MSDESLFREVDEEVRQEQYKKLWNAYGKYFIALCLAVIVAVAGVKGYQYWQQRQAEQAAILFFDGLKKATDGKSDEAEKALAAVTHAGFKQLAIMQQAILLAEQGKTTEAVAAFDAVAADAAMDPTIRDLARIRAGYLLVDSRTPDELLARLGVFDREGHVWRHAAREIFGVAAYRAGDYAMADRYMNAIFADAQSPANMRERAQIMIQLITPKLGK